MVRWLAWFGTLLESNLFVWEKKAPFASQWNGSIFSQEIRFLELHQRATEGNIPNICKSFLFERKDVYIYTHILYQTRLFQLRIYMIKEIIRPWNALTKGRYHATFIPLVHQASDLHSFAHFYAFGEGEIEGSKSVRRCQK